MSRHPKLDLKSLGIHTIIDMYFWVRNKSLKNLCSLKLSQQIPHCALPKDLFAMMKCGIRESSSYSTPTRSFAPSLCSIAALPPLL